MSESNQDGREEWKLPKNVRQIGDGSGEKKIYVEDYVVTFLNRLEEKGQKRAILLGEIRERGHCMYIFADGALEVESFYMDEEAKEGILENMGTYFSGKRVVGWFLVSEESPFVMKKEIIDIFEQEFPGEDQILLVKDPEENETTVFMMEDGIPAEQPGYYVYYDKNPAMQEYLIAGNRGASVDGETREKDEAIKRFRRILRKKTPGSENQGWKPGKLARLAGGFLVMTVLSLGVTMIYHYDRMKEVEQSLARLTSNVDSQIEYVTDDSAAPVMLHIEETETPDGEENRTEKSTETAGEETDEKETVTRTPATEAAEEAEQTEKTEKTAAPSPRATYLVKVGDTLAGISTMYYGNLDMVEEICSLNGISDENTILPGQKILLP